MNQFDLKRERLNRGLSLGHAAQQIGISRDALVRFEQGISRRPATAKKIAEFYEVEVTDLISLEDAA